MGGAIRLETSVFLETTPLCLDECVDFICELFFEGSSVKLKLYGDTALLFEVDGWLPSASPALTGLLLGQRNAYGQLV